MSARRASSGADRGPVILTLKDREGALTHRDEHLLRAVKFVVEMRKGRKAGMSASSLAPARLGFDYS